MNNSDYNDFKNWQNDGDDENNPFNPNGFFYYGPVDDKFKKMWENINNKPDDEFMNNMKDYLNIDDIMKNIPNMSPIGKKYIKHFRKNQNPKNVTFTQDEYLKLIEIRGYLAITEQYAHVKALDKVLNQVKMVPLNNPDKGNK
jgi:hypothetical protein